MFPPHLAMSGQAKPLGNVHPAGQEKKIFSQVGWWWWGGGAMSFWTYWTEISKKQKDLPHKNEMLNPQTKNHASTRWNLEPCPCHVS